MAYDANGNRTTLSIGGSNYTYTTPANKNRLSSTSGPSPARTFAYNAAGMVTGDGQFTLTHNDRGRMSQAVKGSTTVTYGYDGVGQRVKKAGPTSVVPTGTNYFVYNEEGRLLGEYNSSGAVIQEYVWLGTMPIAVLQGTTASPTVFYVYADQIDRPWVITNTANQIRWRWDTSPFGELAASENPSGLGTFAFNQRLPGQYRDAETGLFYNYFRDYDPQTGRYVQSDPIGLDGGINPYGYAIQNPLSYVDPLGLNPLEPLERHVLAHASRGNWKEALKTLEEITEAGRAQELLRQCASRRGAQLVRELKDARVGTGARSGQHGAPFSRAGAELQREANQVESLSPELASALRTQAERLIQQGRSISHR